LQDLEQIAKLAENFAEQRSKLAKGSHDDLADTLDQEGSSHASAKLFSSDYLEGVNLWNISGLLRTSNEESGGNAHVASRTPFAHPKAMSTHVGKVRLAALRLIEAGLEARPGTESTCCNYYYYNAHHSALSKL
jgi:hypothetical protein